MKYYSDFTVKYVQDICDALTDAGIVRKSTQEPFSPESFETLTEFLQDYVVKPIEINAYLNERHLLNRGRCPYTGESIDSSSPKWTWMRHRSVHVSPKGLAMMQKEDDEDYEKVMGKPAPPRNSSTGGKSGCYIATVCYESEFAPEVLMLKKYRDNVLSKTSLGKIFIKWYYFISPSIAKKMQNHKYLNSIIRRNILDKIVDKISK